MTIRVATFNERGDKHGVQFPQRGRDLQHVLKNADLVGMQEWPGIEGSMAFLNEQPGWASYRPPHGPPVAWRTDTFRLLERHEHQVAAARNVLPLPGRRSHLPAIHATEVVLQRLDNGHTVTLIDGHSPAHVEIAGHRRPGARGKMYTEFCDGMAELYAAAAKRGRVFVTADWNWNYRDKPVSKFDPKAIMWEAGARACWHNRAPQHTLGRRCVDVIYSQHNGLHVTTLHTASDHRTVVVTYE